MTEKTAQQIANFKRQTIGVEIEMNHITRNFAAQIAAQYFGTGRFENTVSRNGYMTWSAWDAQGREWKFSRDSSIAGPETEECELITPILRYDDIELLQGLLRKLREAGAKSSPSRGCGVHIHIGAKGHTPQSIRNLVNIMAAHEKQIGRAINIAEDRTERYCKTVDPSFLKNLNRQKPQTFDALADTWYGGAYGPSERRARYNPSRYHMLNLHATFTKGTIEFRLFQFSEERGIHAGELKAYIQLCLAMSELAKELKSASPKPPQTENEKYALRCWLLRLGFIGGEFATARKVLMARMSGNAAWR